MNKFTKWFLTIGAKFACEKWWPFWSNIRWHKAIRTNIEILDTDKVKTVSEARQLVSKVYKKFTWTKDGADQLWDSITPPPQNYQNYLDGEIKDDCDGFHSTIYHFLYNSDLECYLLSVIARGCSHCVLIFKLGKSWYVDDYDKVYNGFSTIEAAIEDYNTKYIQMYTTKSEVYYNSLTKFDYEKGKFKNQPFKEIKD